VPFDEAALPGGAGLPGGDPYHKDAEMTVDVGAVHLQRLQAAAGLLEQHLLEQPCHGPAFAIVPVHVGREAVAGRRVEVLAGRRKGQAQLGRVGLGGQPLREAEEHRHVRRHVDEGRSCRHDAILDAQVRRAVVVEADQRPVPAPDRAVVQADVGEPPCRRVGDQRQQYWMVRPVLGEALLEGRACVARAKGDPPLGRGDVDGLLEERDAGLLPEQATEEQRRVRRRRHHRGRQDDGGVVVAVRRGPRGAAGQR
jgi:hypothetical protein